MMKLVMVEEHGSAYAIRDGEFIGVAMMADGGLDVQGGELNWWVVEEAPKSYKARHRKALKQLGVKDPEIYLKRVAYYKEEGQ